MICERISIVVTIKVLRHRILSTDHDCLFYVSFIRCNTKKLIDHGCFSSKRCKGRVYSNVMGCCAAWPNTNLVHLYALFALGVFPVVQAIIPVAIAEGFCEIAENLLSHEL